MKKLILSAALLLLAVPNAFAAGDAEATKDNSGMMKHCQSMMKDGKMMEGMPKQMTDKCNVMMKDNGMKGMKMDAMPADTGKPDTPNMKDDSK
jgi:hypothetical protein